MFERYAIFYTPSGAFADWGAAWLGWDSAAGCIVPQPQIADLDVAGITATPRKYGLHGTLKAPFRLAHGRTEVELRSATEAFSHNHPPAEIEALTLRHTHGFVALRPTKESKSLRALAAQAVRSFEPFRAPLNDADVARRRKARLTERQDAQLMRWGYPYVFEDFNFHLTLSGRMPPAKATTMIDALTPQMQLLVPAPYPVDAIALMGQDADGMFHQIARHPLTPT